MDKTCMMCGAKMTESVIPVKSYGKEVFAIDSVINWDCPTGEECESGGGYQSWTAIGRLSDLMEVISDRPLFAKHNPETNHWEQCPAPEDFNADFSDPV